MSENQNENGEEIERRHPHSPLIRSKGKPQRNIVTMMVTYGRELSLVQRIAYSMFSLFALSFGLAFLLVASQSFRDGDLLLACVWFFWSAILISIGVAGIVNVLKFPRA